MAKIIKNGTTFSDTGAMVASGVTYNNTSSGLSAVNAQGAIDEVSAKVDNLVSLTKSYNIAPSDWSASKTYTITDDLITTGTNESTQTIGYNPNLYDDALYKELRATSIRISSVSNGEIVLKCMGDLPTHTLPITVTFGVGAQPVELTFDSVPTAGSGNPITSGGILAALRDNILVNDTTTPALDYDTTILNSGGLNLNYNPFLKVVTVRTSDVVKKALSSGTTYVLATIPDEVISVIGHHYTTAPFTTSANQTGLLLFNTWDTGNTIEITPRGAIASGASIYCCMTFFA